LSSNQLTSLVPKAINDNYLVLVCAYNEEGNLGQLLSRLDKSRVLIVDDASDDKTREIASSMGFRVLSHPTRLGKLAGLRDGVDYARTQGYDVIVNIDADTIPERGSIDKLVRALKPEDVGGASSAQVPIQAGSSVAYNVDELIWSILANGKKFQMLKDKDSYLGAVMFAFKIGTLKVTEGANDDEVVGSYLHTKKLRIVYVEDSVVFFDASSNLRHIMDRRVRMNFGHMMEGSSGAPTATFAVAGVGLVNSIAQKKRRLLWVLPAVAFECIAKAKSWNDFRKCRFSKYERWVSPDKSKSPLNISSSHID
jgi:glycosyltransferase involved in cell wall biosynthesis